MEDSFIKIDQSLVRRLEKNASNRAHCSAMISMVHGLGVQVITEGIETPGRARIILGLGCDYGQDFRFSTPLPPDGLLAPLKCSNATPMPV